MVDTGWHPVGGCATIPSCIPKRYSLGGVNNTGIARRVVTPAKGFKKVSAPRISSRKFAVLANCDEKQVRRAIAAGKLKPGADGLLDPDLVDSGWRRPIRSSKPGADTLKVSAPSVRTLSAPRQRPDVELNAPFDVADHSSEAAEKILSEHGAKNDLVEAIRLKENYNALLKQLEYEQKSCALVDFEVAQAVFFEEFRAQRDAWLNWPIRIAPLLAADLGLEADKVTEVLTAHVHKHISSLGEPEANFGGREG